MNTTYQRVSQNLVALLNDRDYKVVALRGGWGTGKTHLWDKVSVSGAVGGKAPVYVSLFGVRSIKDLKLRILQSISGSDRTAFNKIVETSGGFVAGVMKRFTGYSAEDALVLWVSSFVSGRLIVIDDVERKHSSLGTDEVMGFLNEYTELHKAKFLVLLNLEKLDGELWSTLHEKVVDGEIVLEPAPDEAFDVAADSNDGKYIPYAREACSKLKITNIRVIRKILKVLQKVEEAVTQPHNVYIRWVGSTVLLVALHYRAVEDAPTLDYIKAFNSYERGFLDVIEGEEDEQKKKWSKLLESLGFHSLDEFELLVQSYLNSGLMDHAKLKAVLERYQEQYRRGDYYAKRRELFISYWWDPSLSKVELREKAQEVLTQVDTLSPGEISELVGVFERFGDADLAREALDRWKATLPTRAEFNDLTDSELLDDFDQLHKGVKEALEPMFAIPHLTLAQAIKNIVYGKWNSRETAVVEASTVADYRSTIHSLKLVELKNFLEEHVKWIGTHLGTDHFPNGVSNFVQACRDIYAADPEGRLAEMIRRVFVTRGRTSLLE